MNSNNIGVYKITVKDHLYVGSTAISFKRRISNHLSNLTKGKHANPILQSLYNKYGYVDFEIIEIVEDKENVLKREQYYIDTLNPDINICKLAKSSLGRIVSQETRNKISNALKGRPLTKETIEKQVSIRKGKPLSESHRKSLSLIGIKNNTKKAKSVLQFDKEGVFIQRWNSVSEINRLLGYHKGNIRSCCNGLLKTSHNYMWKYEDIS